MLRALSSNGSLLARACGPTGAPGHDRNMCVQIVRMKQSIEEEKMGTEASWSEDGQVSKCECECKCECVAKAGHMHAVLARIRHGGAP